MADKKYRHTTGSLADPSEFVSIPLNDESDGTFTPVERARLMAWDGSAWIKVRSNASGALLLDRGGAGADLSISQTYTSAQAGTVLLSVATTGLVHVTSCIVALANTVTASPAASVSAGANVVLKHPGIPAGGGIAATDMDLGAPAFGDDITFTCDAPTNGSISVTVHYYLET
jgi:hypothetical protein